ncbi:MAG: D-2-hydroxyacid dehydrogenase [Planctomycetes bacterium]|nr:D-2-hydroxyacid dehydrogenase [Planctomycetota bacterium]
MKIVLHDQFPIGDDLLGLVRDAAPQARVVVADKDQLTAELADAEIFYGWHSPEVFAHAPKLRWIQSSAAGLDRLLTPEVVARGLIITNASGIHASAVAETAWALTLAVARGLHTYIRQQQDHTWQWTTLYDMFGGTAGIIGLGGIGRQYARVARAFDMRVIAVDPHVREKPADVAELRGMDRLDDLLRQSDMVLVSCPYTPETRYLINRTRLSLMKPTAILVNIARGGIIDEPALAEALRAGKLAGAGLDVTEVEPLPADNPLWDAPNLVISPHCGGVSSHRMRKLIEFFCENLKRYQAGQPLSNLVDQQKGYPVPAS